ncbi:nuclease [Comamonas sp. Z1]|nr:nuclease [Comamonas sp. Z1]
MMRISVLASLACAFLPLQVNAQNWSETGKVIYVDDGDTVVLLRSDNSRLKIRLSDIDAPESMHGHKRPGQPLSQKATDYLKSLVHGKIVNAHCYEYDRYKRGVCTITIDGQSVNLKMVDAGLAWANRANPRYVRDTRVYEAEVVAKKQAMGVWSLPNQVAPWRWRKDCWNDAACEGAEQ